MRPIELGIHAVYYPFRSHILSLTPNIGLGIYDGNYMNAGLKAEANLGNWIVLFLQSQLEDRLWNQEVGLNINIGLIELDLLVGGQSSDFSTSFTCGVTGSLGMKIGL
jgi:hypothetical protein